MHLPSLEDQLPLAAWREAPLNAATARSRDTVAVILDGAGTAADGLPHHPPPDRASTPELVGHQLAERARLGAARGIAAVGVYPGRVAAELAESFDASSTGDAPRLTLAAAPQGAPMDFVALEYPRHPYPYLDGPQALGGMLVDDQLRRAEMRRLELLTAALSLPLELGRRHRSEAEPLSAAELDVSEQGRQDLLGDGRVRLHGLLVWRDGVLICEHGYDDGALPPPASWLVLSWTRGDTVIAATRLNRPQLELYAATALDNR
jgi:hypothetical protein